MSSVAPVLTIGIPVYDDFQGAYFTIQSLRMTHGDVLANAELLVVDNNPVSEEGKTLAGFVQNWVRGPFRSARYEPYAELTGPACAKDQAVRRAQGEYVLVLDSHVLLDSGSLAKTLEWIHDRRLGDDLYHGPLVYDDLRNVSTHFADNWRGEMWGTWDTDPRGDPGRPEYTGEPFEIPANGCGLFLVRRESWLGFHPEFYGFGGEEYYIHEKYKKAGRTVWCLPWLRWVHRFGRPNGVPYPLTRFQKIRNYALGLGELGISLDRCRHHFLSDIRVPTEEFEAAIAAAKVPARTLHEARFQEQKSKGCGGCGKKATPVPVASVEEAYAKAASTPSDINEHVPTLREYASRVERVTEFGWRTGVATAGLLAAKPKVLRTYDRHDSPTVRGLVMVPGDTDFGFILGDSTKVEIEPTDLLFIDTKHTADHLWAELSRHYEKVSRYIILHDTVIFGERGEDGGPGLLPAVRRFVTEHPEWCVVRHDHNNHGLLVLSRHPEDKPPLPSKLTMAANFAKAVAAHVASGAEHASPEEMEHRLSLCSLCPFRHDEQCSECGCYVAKKAEWKEQACPIGKW